MKLSGLWFNKIHFMIFILFRLFILYIALFTVHLIFIIFLPNQFLLTFTNIKNRNRNNIGIYYIYLLSLCLILFGCYLLAGFGFILTIKWIVYDLLLLNVIWTIYAMIFNWNSIHMSTSLISDISKFLNNGYHLDFKDAKSYLSIFIIDFINDWWFTDLIYSFKNKPLLILSFLIHDLLVWLGVRSLTHKGFKHVWSKPWIIINNRLPWFFTLLRLGFGCLIVIFFFVSFYYTFNLIIYSILAIFYSIYLLFIHFKELSINKNNNIKNSRFLRMIYEFKVMNINLAPIAALIQQIHSCKFNSILFIITGVFIILIINVIKTSPSFINLIIKIENSIIDLFYIFNDSINPSQTLNHEGSNINQQMGQASWPNEEGFVVSNIKQNRQHKYSFINRKFVVPQPLPQNYLPLPLGVKGG